MKRLILSLCVLAIGIGGCALPREYELKEVKGKPILVTAENSRQEGPNLACIYIWSKEGKLLRTDCSGGPSLSQSMVRGTFDGAVGAYLYESDNYDGDSISIENTSKNSNRQKQGQYQKQNQRQYQKQNQRQKVHQPKCRYNCRSY